LIYDEYIGPDHHMYEQEVLDILDEIDSCLAEEYRWDALRRQTRRGAPKPSLEWMLATDPSEGVHSSLILPLTYQYFEVIFRRDYGGTVMRPFFTGILPNFDFDDPKDQTIARLIIKMEDFLLRSGTIPHYHTMLVGRKLQTPLGREEIPDPERINFVDWAGFERFGKADPILRSGQLRPADFSDENWQSGVGARGRAILLVPADPAAREVLREGCRVVFEDQSMRRVLAVERNEEMLLAFLEGKPLDPAAYGYPHEFCIEPPEAH
jgi:hypothetical protein